MSRYLFRLGRTAARHPWRAITSWLVAALAITITAAAVGGDPTDTFEVPGVDSQLATELLESAGDDQAGLTARVVVVEPAAAGDGSDTAGASPTLEFVGAELARLADVVGVAPPVVSDERADGSAVAVFTLQYPVVEEASAASLEHLKAGVEDLRGSTGLQIEAGGELFFYFEEASGSGGELVGIAVAVVVLLVAFGSLLAAGLPIGIALFGLATSIGALTLLTNVMDMPSWASDLGTMIGLGVGIDYALFLVTRHRELLAEGWDVDESVGRAVATSGQAVVFAGGTVVVAILGLGVAGVPAMTAGGVGISLVVLVMVLAAISLLPALLGLAGRRIERVRTRSRSSQLAGEGAVGSGTAPAVGRTWEAWGRHVSRHAARYAIGVTVLLLALTAPVLDLRLGFPDEGTQAESRTERRAYDLVEAGFGPGTNGPLLIAVDLDQASTAPSAGVAAVAELRTAISQDAGIASVDEPRVDEIAGVATLVAYPTTAPQDDATFATVERLRDTVLPDVLAGTDVAAHVGGATASFGDVANRVSDRLPLFIAAVIGLSFILLTVLFRSIVVPIKAALLNLLSIGAAYGVLVAVFQWEWGASWIGVNEAVPIVSFIPMFMFAILFGLSMDYEVFLLSRVREEYLRSGDNDRSVIVGIASTARVITSAALIMISVFAGFVFGDDPIVKMMGLGLATAIFVDATIVRLVLVPATMTLMGDANWWLPRRLDRVLPHVDVEAAPDAPPVAPEPELVQAGASR